MIRSSYAAMNSTDINFTAHQTTLVGTSMSVGWTQIAETPSRDSPLHSNLTQVGILSSELLNPATTGGAWRLAPGQTKVFLTVVRTSLETSSGELQTKLQADFNTAQAMAANGTLQFAHVTAWGSRLWSAGIEISGRQDIAIATNASIYGILSAVRSDRPFGLSPGGLTSGYFGHSFWYVAPA